MNNSKSQEQHHFAQLTPTYSRGKFNREGSANVSDQQLFYTPINDEQPHPNENQNLKPLNSN